MTNSLRALAPGESMTAEATPKEIALVLSRLPPHFAGRIFTIKPGTQPHQFTITRDH